MQVLRRGLLVLVLLLAASPAHAATPANEVEVVVTLQAPPLARAVAASRALAPSVRSSRLDLDSATSRAHLQALSADQHAVETRIAEAIPEARVRRRYQVVLNALAVVLPADEVPRLAAVPGVAEVQRTVSYGPRLDRGPRQIGLPALWGANLSTAGNGVKIAVLDDGVDHTHPFFAPAGYSTPAGFPKGDRSFTTAKVIAARSFAPRSTTWRNARRPFDSEYSGHGTHVAGIAAGNYGIFAGASTSAVSGAAPRAYIGNYKVLSVPTASGVGLNGNSPEIAAGIEAAVRDGMDVINLSLGEPEVEPTRDLVTRALDAAADAGVVPVVASGNDFVDHGFGTVGSPASAAKAITVGAVATGRNGRVDGVAAFSSSGPTPLSHRMKPEVVAPGAGILSSVPRVDGTWGVFDGTSMAAPHVAGTVAVLRQRHPTWTVAQIKSALVTTGAAVTSTSSSTVAALATRAGGGRVDAPRAASPLFFAEPAAVSFGLLRRGEGAARSVELTDAGGGAGTWTVRVLRDEETRGAAVAGPPTVVVPGRLDLTATAEPAAPTGDVSGYVVLERAGERRRIPYWVGVSVPRLGEHRAPALTRRGVHRASTSGAPALVSHYRYPTRVGGRPGTLAGPERVFRVRLAGTVANFGVAVVSRAAGVRVEPRIVEAADENRLIGYGALPINLNPYLESFLEPRLVAGAVRPRPGVYHVVFDSPSRATAGRFSFRFWINDTTPPRVRLLTPSVRRGNPVVLAASDACSGLDPGSVVATVDGRRRPAEFRSGRVFVNVNGLSRGRHRLVVQVSDYQETRNNENVPAILPNTRRIAVAFTIR
jgi:subtilisin family serine protease